MARKNILETQLLSGRSLASSFTGPVTVVQNLDNISYQIDITTSNSTGTFVVEASDNYDSNEITNAVTDSGTWAALPLGGTPTVAGANDIILINLNQLPFKAVRVRYISTVAGTGTCNLEIVAKQIGG